MPPIGNLINGVDFAELKWVLKAEVVSSIEETINASPEVAINYGVFINAIITFLIVAFAMFMVINSYNKLTRKSEKKQESNLPIKPISSREEVLLTEIRDLLKKKSF